MLNIIKKNDGVKSKTCKSETIDTYQISCYNVLKR